jgi:hypothetical protein
MGSTARGPARVASVSVEGAASASWRSCARRRSFSRKAGLKALVAGSLGGAGSRVGALLARLYRGFRVTTIPINELRTDFRMTYAVCGLR